MDPKTAIILLSQSEKIKAGLIWIANGASVFSGLPERHRKGAQMAFHAFAAMLLHEVRIVGKATGDDEWSEVEKHVDMALVMIDSGAPAEAPFHLTRALSRTANQAKKAMEALEGWGLL